MTTYYNIVLSTLLLVFQLSFREMIHYWGNVMPGRRASVVVVVVVVVLVVVVTVGVVTRNIDCEVQSK